MKKEKLIETLGSLIKAEPKDYDYDRVAEILAVPIYESIKKHEFSLRRSAEHDNNNPRENVYTDNLLVSVAPEDIGEEYVEVVTSFQNDNMKDSVLSNRVIRKVMELDKSDEGRNFFDDVVLVLGYTNVTSPDFVDYLSKMDSPTAGRPVEINFSFILEEDKDTFLERYNGKDNDILTIGGKVEKFIFFEDGEKID